MKLIVLQMKSMTQANKITTQKGMGIKNEVTLENIISAGYCKVKPKKNCQQILYSSYYIYFSQGYELAIQ